MLNQIIQNNKKIIKIVILTLIFIILLYSIFHSRNYEIKYSIDSIEIKESYDKKNKVYQFFFKYNDKDFAVNFVNKYIHGKKIINKINIKEEGNTICIIPEGKKIDFYPLCYQNNESISYHQLNNKDIIPNEFYKKISTDKSKYNSIEINYLNNKKYYLWNYKGFYVINGLDNQTINIFNEDVYNIPLSYKINNSIVIADYNSKYKFDKFYLIQTKNNKIKEIESEKELSFESYINGSYKNKLYFMDKKNKKQYEINIKKLSINDITSKNKGKVLKENEWEEVSINKLSAEEHKFSKYQSHNYKIIDNKLYLIVDGLKTLISNYNVKEIVEIENETVYYIVDDKLYYYNYTDGEVLIMSYFEWNFNYKNMIYIF